MDDLLGEDWKAPNPQNRANAPSNATNFASAYSNFRASPTPPQSGIASPHNISRPSSTLNGGSKAPSQDQFGSLLSLKSQKPANTLTILEQQQQALAAKRRQQEEQSRLWDTFGSGSATPETRSQSTVSQNTSNGANDDVDDILAAFNKTAPVSKASHFPPPGSDPTSGRSTPAAAKPSALSRPAEPLSFNDDDDDPFELGSMPSNSNGTYQTQAATSVSNNDDDDILGDLGKPVQDVLPRPSPAEASRPAVGESEAPSEALDKGVAELVDMGFPVDNARIALAETGGNVQNAVGWLLQQAHEESKQKARNESSQRRESPAGSRRSPQRRQQGDQSAIPSWAREDSRSSSSNRKQDGSSSTRNEKDAAQIAQDFGSKLFKGANSLWKASQKQMTKTISEFQQERDSNQPKWMQESSDSSRSGSQNRQLNQNDARQASRQAPEVTDEAAMLDMPRDRPQRPSRPTANDRTSDLPIRGNPLAEPEPRRPTPPRFPQQSPAQDKRPASKLSRQEVEDQSAQAYISPVRRKKATPVPEPPKEPEVDLFSPAPQPAPKPATTVPNNSTQPKRPTAPKVAPTPTRPAVPPRSVPNVSPSALSTSAAHRQKGGEAFKRGDYASAHELYTAALSPLPPTHPITIIVLTNRCLTALKTGDPKAAVSDADRALEIIGVGQGAGESIDLGGGEGVRDMREQYGKALMRKAEALEHMEKWSDAGAVWRSAIEAGAGGAVSIRGRDRCEKAANPQRAVPASAPARPAASKPSAALKPSSRPVQHTAVSNAASAEAVKKLREASAAADKVDDEKFALYDQVDARLTAWKGTKTDNLRALLQSLDTVLWAEAGWKKVGMSDLVLPNKVKIIYMKAIAKVHPDKVSLNCVHIVDFAFS